MKRERTIVRSVVLALALVGLLAFGSAGTASAAPLYFDTASSGTNWNDGTTWNWSATPGGVGGAYADSPWVGGSGANFEGTGAAVTIAPAGIASVDSITFVTNGYSIGGGSIGFVNTTSTLTITAGLGITGTINSNTNGLGNVTGAGNKIAKLGSGKVVLAGNTVLVTDVDGTLAAGFTVEGSGELQITGALKAASTLQANRGNFTNTVGAASADNTLTISGASGTSVLAGGLTVGGGTFGSNGVVISRPGTSATPSYRMIGNGAQLNMGVSSSDNSVSVSNGAYILQSGGGGANTWTIGTNSGANSNSILVTGSNAGNPSTIYFGSNQVMAVGVAGSSNSITVSAGGLFKASRFAIGANGGSSNSITLTGPGSTMTTSATSNSLFEIGAGTGANNNYMSIADGGIYNFSGSGTSRNFSVGGKGQQYGAAAGGDNNYIEITGAYSAFNITFALPVAIGGTATGAGPGTVTDGGTGNHLDINNGGSMALTGAPVYVLGTSSAVNLGNGTGIGTLTVGAATNYTAGVYLKNADGRLKFDSGRLFAGVAGNLVSGLGKVNLDGAAYVSTALTNTIASEIYGNGDLTKEGIGTLTLSFPTNSYTGDTTVAGGTLSLASAYLADTSSVIIASGAVLDLTHGLIDTIAELYLNGTAQGPGTYNSSSDPLYITGTGSLYVVPEPATLSLLVLGGLAVLGRRRRS